MADYWKSQPKKFCTYCKCWIADNKPSVEFHERGKKHKENVVQRISEIKKKSVDKAKQEEKSSKEFAAMEEAALKAYQEDLKRLGVSPAPEDTTSSIQIKPQKSKKKKEKVALAVQPASKDEWTKGVSPEGYPYYYNTRTGESQWEEPEGFQEGTQNSDKVTSSTWVKGVTEEGHIYYYNTETGESKWEKPEGSGACSDDPQSGKSSEDETAAEESKAVTSKESTSTADESTEQGEEKTMESNTETQKPKINFRKNKTEQINIAEEIKPESKEDDTNATGDQESRAIPEEKQPKAPKKSTPYGEWEEIREEEDPYECIDLQLPSAEEDILAGPALEVAQEPKVKFREKTITSLGDDTIVGEPVFRKRKIENGKSRNLRQRVSDQ
ncbi:WW domain-binding protein 4 [Rhinatrema bivittatum]|uniref:WW domain-binding protein 4 n=1 Tax=Rhinatrema bivittatum TaxID=194408 RepID=UPI0011294544|nr:WW domain-binding protein 4 [Rhinatrema bivittatum]